MCLLAKTLGIALSLAITATSNSSSACDLLCWLGELHAGCGIARNVAARADGKNVPQSEMDMGGHPHCKSARQSGEHESISASTNCIQSRRCVGQQCGVTLASASLLTGVRANCSLHGDVAASVQVRNVCNVIAHPRPIRSPESPPGSVPLYLSVSPLRI